jgi:hypothetical protein
VRIERCSPGSVTERSKVSPNVQMRPLTGSGAGELAGDVAVAWPSWLLRDASPAFCTRCGEMANTTRPTGDRTTNCPPPGHGQARVPAGRRSSSSRRRRAPGTRLLGDSDLAANLTDRHPAPDPLQHRGDLLDGKALLLHGTPSWTDWPDWAANSRSRIRPKAGALKFSQSPAGRKIASQINLAHDSPELFPPRGRGDLK